MRERGCADLARVPNDYSRLANSFRADRERINAPAQNITRKEEAQVIAEEFFARIDRLVRSGAEIARQFFDPRQLVRRKTAGVYRHGVHFAASARAARARKTKCRDRR